MAPRIAGYLTGPAISERFIHLFGDIAFASIENQERPTELAGMALQLLHECTADALLPVLPEYHELFDAGAVPGVGHCRQAELDRTNQFFIFKGSEENRFLDSYVRHDAFPIRSRFA